MRNVLTSLLIALLFVTSVISPAARAQNPSPPPPPPPASPPAQDPDDEVIRINTSLVQTDVSVFDRKGNPVTDLQQGDFEVKVDGTVQPLAFFERVATAGAASPSASANNTTSRDGSLPVATTNEGERVVTFYIDDLHLTPLTVARSRQVLGNFIDKQMTPGTLGLIFAASGSVGFLAQPTSDKATLKAAARRINYQSRSSFTNDRPVMSEVQAMLIDRGDREALAYQIQQTNLQGGYGSTAEQYVKNRARTIRRQAAQLSVQIIRNLEAVIRSRPYSTTRQIVFFISNGFAIDNSESDIIRYLRRVTDQAARRNVVIYTLDARGLTSGGFDASSDVVSDIANITSATAPSYSVTGEINLSQEVLRTLAEDTGGRAMLNNNSLESMVANVVNETNNYYLLGWRPVVIDETTGEPKFRRVEVNVRGRSGLKVRARRGYFNRPSTDAPATNATATNAKTEANKPVTLNSALNSPEVRRDIPFALYTAFTNDTSGSTLTAAVELTSDSVNFDDTAKNGEREATINLACVVFDDAGKPVYSTGRDVQLTRPTDNPARPASITTNFVAPITKPGLYQFRVAARDARSGRVGTAFQWTEVPEIKPRRLALSSLLIAESASGTRATAATKSDSNTDTPDTLNIARRFRRSSRLLLQLFIYNAAADAGAAADVTMELQVKRDQKVVLGAPAHSVAQVATTDASRIPYVAAIPMRGLAPGAYSLLAIAVDRRTRSTVTQEISFTVE